jgi:anti-sigma factor RsiW
MKDSSPLNENDQAELVAYLDGELRGEAARRVEARLVKDRATQSEAEILKQTWDLLDYLPRAQPSASFTQQTVKKLIPLTQLAAHSWLRLLRWRGWQMKWAAGLLLAFSIGVIACKLLMARRTPGDAELTHDLRLIENKHLYEIGVSVKYLEELDKPDLFGEGPSES